MIERETIVKAICTATEEVFSTMLGLESQAGPAGVERVPGVTDGVVSFVGLAGNWVGTGMLACSATLACKLASHLLGSDYAPGEGAVDEEVLDAVAEITNMIVGNAKNHLETELGPMGMSIPTVIFGRNFTTRSVGNGEWTVVPFLCGAERMDVKFCLARSRKPIPVRHGFSGPRPIEV